MMTDSKDLLLAILSMDAYNQGYGKGLDHGKPRLELPPYQGKVTFFQIRLA